MCREGAKGDHRLCFERGLNALITSCNRYYRPHIDGAWPTSGLDKHGNYRYDIFDAENKNGRQFVKGDPSMETCASSRRELSRLTFLIYLNEVRRY